MSPPKVVYFVAVENSDGIDWNTAKVFTKHGLAELYADGISAAYGGAKFETMEIEQAEGDGTDD